MKVGRADYEKSQSIKFAVSNETLSKLVKEEVSARWDRYKAGNKLLEKCGGSKLALKRQIMAFRKKEASKCEMKKGEGEGGDTDGNGSDSDDFSFCSMDSMSLLVEEFVVLDDSLELLKKRKVATEKKLQLDSA